MKSKIFVVILGLIPALALAQNAPNMVGTWKGIGNAAVASFGTFHPTEAGKENAVRIRHVEFVLTIDRAEGRNFVGSMGATNDKDPTNVKHKELILGAFAKDMKSGVMVNETGSFTFKLADDKNLEICYSQVSTKPRVASCFEMVKQ